MTGKAKNGYTGALATPRQPWGPLSLLDTAEEIERRKTAETEDFLNKLGLLLDHYGIKRDAPNKFPELLYTLLLVHVPGFQTARGPGRGRAETWTDRKRVELVATVRSMVESGEAINQESALRKLAEAGRFGTTNAASLRRRYSDASNSAIVTFFEKTLELAGGKISWSEVPY
jgi:hypothetical protein